MKTSYLDLKNKKILITGGTSGIGQKIVEDLVLQGASLTLIGRSIEKLAHLQKMNPQIEKIFVCDQSKISEIENSLKDMTTSFDGIVFSAGVADFSPIKFLKLEKTIEIFNTNFFSNVLIVQYLIRKKLINKGASIIFICSIAQYVAELGTSIYSSSKAALSAFARNLALEVSVQQIRVNTISPGLVQTNLLNDEKGLLSEVVINKNLGQYPLGLGQVQDVSSSVLFLLSSESKWITGTDIKMDGGFCLK